MKVGTRQTLPLITAFLLFCGPVSTVSAADVAKEVIEFRELRGFVVGGLTFNSDGTQLATSGMLAAAEVHVWNWATRRANPRVLPMSSVAGAGNAICFSDDGALLAAGYRPDAQHGIIRVWNAQTWAGHDIVDLGPATQVMGIGFTPDGKLLIRTVDRAGRRTGNNIVANSTATLEAVWGLETQPFVARTLALSLDGQLAAVAGDTSTLGPEGPPITHHPEILIIDISHRTVLRAISKAFPDNNQIQTLAWSADSRELAAGAIVGGSFTGPDAVRIFDVASGKQILGETATTALVSGLSYSRDGRYLIEGYLDGHVRIWDGAHRQLLQTINVNDHFDTPLAISRDSRYMALGVGLDVSVWELK